MTPPRIRVVAGLFARDGRVLVQERAPHKTRGGLWEFPGGKVEPGESDPQALARECAEELGVTVSVGSEVWRTVHDYADLTVELVLLTATLPEGAEVQALDAHRLAWVELGALGALPFCDADRDLVAALSAGALPVAQPRSIA